MSRRTSRRCLASRLTALAAEERQSDFAPTLKRGAGHDMAPKYAAMIGHSVRAERLPEPEAR